MYSLVYGIVYLLSLLPFAILYRLSDLVYFLMFYILKYRKNVVIKHVSAAFPHLSTEERSKIVKTFYRNFCDLWVEMIKVLSMSAKTAQKRVQLSYDCLLPFYESGKSAQFYTGHFMNWEYINVCVPFYQPYTFLGIYTHLSSPVMERLVFKLRSRFGSVLLRAGHIKEKMKNWHHKQYLMGLGADQSPSNPNEALWLTYLNQPTGFIEGPWKRAVQLGQPTFYLKVSKPKRGYYQFTFIPFEEKPADKTPAELLQKFVHMLEEDIHANPALYLWTHKRWKKPWLDAYLPKWVDKKHKPPTA